MPEARKPLEALTPWISFDLEDGFADGGGVLKLRLRHIDEFEAGAIFLDANQNYIRSTAIAAMEAVAEWDLSLGGKPIPVTPENTVRYLQGLLAQTLRPEPLPEGADPDAMSPPKKALAYEIVGYARDRKNFLKN